MVQTSAWFDGVHPLRHAALVGDLEVDVAVVGGGWTGLTTAVLAQREGLRVAVVEAREIGTGTSGYTTGKLTTQHGVIYADLVSRHGDDDARRYAEANVAGMRLVAELVDDLQIRCGLTAAPAYVYSRDLERRGSLEDEVAAARRLGLPATFVTDTDLPFEVEGAVRFDDQFHLHPVRYLAGLADTFVAGGGRIFEHSRVTGVDQRDEVVLTTDAGVIHADHVVVATLLPIRTIGGYFAKTRPGRSFGLAARLRGPAPVSLTISADATVRSTRPWPDAGPNGLIVVGAGHETGTDRDTGELLAELVDWTRDTFDVGQIDHHWSAQDYSTPDRKPYVGATPSADKVLVATGFDKWGLSNGAAAAIMITDHLAGRPNRWQSAFDARRIGDAAAIATLIKDNLKVGKDFVAGRLSRNEPRDLVDLNMGDGGRVDIDGDTVGAFRAPNGDLHLVDPTCTHLGCRLEWNSAETSWDCSCHGSRFSPDGSILTGPAVQPLPRIDSTG